MKPYYEHAGITIYHGDCREVLPQLEYDVVVSDPPYGTGWVRGGGAVGEFKAEFVQPEWDVFDVAWIDSVIALRCAIFCPVPRAKDVAVGRKPSAVLYYKKTNPRPLGSNREAIVAWPPPYHMEEWEFETYNGDNPDHPTQKPIDLMLWLVRGMANPGEIVCDPYIGSGTTLVAAKANGNPAIGIEIEEKYCEIAAKRLSQEVLNFSEAKP